MINLKFYAFNAMWGAIILGVSFLFTPAIINREVNLGLEAGMLLRLSLSLGIVGFMCGVGVGLYSGFPPAVTSVAIGICCAVIALGTVGLAQWVANGSFEISGWVLLASFLAGNLMVLVRLFAPLRPSQI